MTPPRVSDTQAQALWAIYRAGMLTTRNQWAYVETDGRVKAQTIKSLGTRELAYVEILAPLQVCAGERVYSSITQWEATLTYAGELWIAYYMADIEGLPPQRNRRTVPVQAR